MIGYSNLMYTESYWNYKLEHGKWKKLTTPIIQLLSCLIEVTDSNSATGKRIAFTNVSIHNLGLIFNKSWVVFGTFINVCYDTY